MGARIIKHEEFTFNNTVYTLIASISMSAAGTPVFLIRVFRDKYEIAHYISFRKKSLDSSYKIPRMREENDGCITALGSYREAKRMFLNYLLNVKT